MVNFKAGGHQGEHKRALAAQANGGEETHVSKEEKLSLGRSGDRAAVNESGVVLKVVAREKVVPENNGIVKAALVNEATGAGPICRPGGDFVLAARSHPLAAPGTILLSEAQRLSLHVCEDEMYEVTPALPRSARTAL